MKFIAAVLLFGNILNVVLSQSPECPLLNDPKYTVHFPHEYDCTKFYKCNWGEAVLMDCPPGLHFNADLEVCDWPAQAGCDSVGPTGPVGDTTPEATTPGAGDTTQGGGGGTTNGAGGTTQGGGVGEGRCPAENGEWAIHFPHEYDCTLFYKCNWGEEVLMECPPGLHFNPELEVCDWPAQAGCDSVGPTGPVGDTTPQTTTQLIIDTTNGAGDTTQGGGGGTTNGAGGTTQGGGVGDGRCPAENGEWAIHLPHEYDCTMFYKCNWGEAVLMDCPPGLHFNPELEVCDWPQDAGCIL